MEQTENQVPDEKLIEIGNAAEKLLAEEHFKAMLPMLVDGAINQFFQSKADEEEKRTEAYYFYQAVNNLVATLNQQVSVRDNILNKEETTVEED